MLRSTYIAWIVISLHWQFELLRISRFVIFVICYFSQQRQEPQVQVGFFILYFSFPNNRNNWIPLCYPNCDLIALQYLQTLTPQTMKPSCLIYINWSCTSQRTQPASTKKKTNHYMMHREVIGAKVKYNYIIIFYLYCHIEVLQVITFVIRGCSNCYLLHLLNTNKCTVIF